MSVRWRLIALSAATFALVTACGSGGGGNKVASLSDAPKPSDQQQAGDSGDKGDGIQKMRDFTKCMREHGVDMPEPKTDPGGGGGMSFEVHGAPGEEDKMKAADEACRQLLPNGGQPPKLDAKQLDELRKQAQCMREHGIDMPDPDPNNPGITLNGGGDPEKEKKAFEECMGKDGGMTVFKDDGGNGGGGGVASTADANPGGGK